MLNKKAFLGPIGDDLPSLIPLVFALILFFSIFSMAWNVFDQNNQHFQDRLAILRVIKTLQSNNYLTGQAKFFELCENAKAVKTIKFRAGLVRLNLGPDPDNLELDTPEEWHFQGIDVTNLENSFYEEKGRTYICQNTDEEISERARDLETLFFPVALESDYRDAENKRHFFVRPMLLVVVAWK